MVARYGLGATLAVAGKSPAEEARVDREAAALVARAYARAARVLRNRNQRRKLAAVAAALVDRETLSGSELALAMR
jgi:ATP-dependent Zn protease